MESRQEFDDMLYTNGCPECGSIETYVTIASINDVDGVPVCLCEDCGHVETEFLREVPCTEF